MGKNRNNNSAGGSNGGGRNNNNNGGGGRNNNNGGGNNSNRNNNNGGQNNNGRNNNSNGGKNNNNNNNNNQKKCNNCSKPGHFAKDCRSNGNNNNNSNACTVCKKPGHTTEKCHFNQNKGQNQNQNNNKQGGRGNITRPCSHCGGWHTDTSCTTKSGTDKKGKKINCKHCSGPHFNNACPTKHGWIGSNSYQNQNHQGQIGQCGNLASDGTVLTACRVCTGWHPDASCIGGIGNTLTMNGVVSRVCLVCAQEHLPENCPLRTMVLGGGGGGEIGGDEWGYNSYPTDLRYEDDDIPSPASYPLQSQYALQPQPETYAPQQYNRFLDPFTSQYHPMDLGRGDPPREYHRPLHRMSDGDIVMEDVEACNCCAFAADHYAHMAVQAKEQEAERLRQSWLQGQLGNSVEFGGWRY